MQILRVDDWSSECIRSDEFDLFICASGYERRSTFLFTEIIGRRAYRSLLVLGFENSCFPVWRAESDGVFEHAGATISIVREDQELSIFELLENSVPRFQKVRLLIDYSSMPRKWINAMLNYFKFCSAFEEVELYFCYSLGMHVDRESVPEYPDSDYQVASIESLTTLEGASVRQKRTLAVVGLGFEWIAPFAACELIEPDEVRVFYADPGSVDGYGERALQLNKLFLDEFSRDDDPLAFPVRSVEHVYRTLGEIIAPVIADQNVALIPLGPKPHVLGCILIANRLPQVTCVYVQGSRESVKQVEAVGSGHLVVTRVGLARDTRTGVSALLELT